MEEVPEEEVLVAELLVEELVGLVVVVVVVVGLVVVGLVVVVVGVLDELEDELVLEAELELEQSFWARAPTVRMP